MMMGMLRRFAALTMLGAVLIHAGCSRTEAGEIVKYTPDERVTAPKISGELLGDSGTYDLAANAGKVVVINFWASWCAPCRLEADDLEALHKALPDVEFVGINIRDEKDKAIAFAEGRSSYPSIFDTAGRIALEFEQVPPNTIPATIIVDREGKIAVVIRKAILEEDLRSLVDGVVAEDGA